MGWSDIETGKDCKNHLNHNRKEGGVCATCLRERLSQIYFYNERPVIVTYSSCSSSSGSPVHSGHRRNGSVGTNTGSLSFRVGGVCGNYKGLKKSRSVAFASRVEDGKKRKGFWSKLLHLKGRPNKLGSNSSDIARERVF